MCYSRKKVLVHICLVLLCILIFDKFQFISCFNLEERLPIIKRGSNGSYFGYSVAQHLTISDETISWILVGAPVGKNNQPGTNRSGALWKCPTTSWLDDCEQVVTDGKRSIDSDELRPPHDDEIKDGQWLGVTVSSQGNGGKVVVCAHRYILKSGESQFGQGLCYTLENDLTYDTNWEPCKGKPTTREHQEYGYCQVGTSSSFLSDGTMILGSPGPYTWRGTLFVMDTNSNFLERDKVVYFGPHQGDSSSPVNTYSYLGMSVTGGKFFGSNSSFVAGAPRSNGTGQVVIFSKNNHKQHNPINVSLIITGEQFASSFGYVVATADLNGDGMDDLIVSAPFYFSRDVGGAVYIYINKNYGFESGYNLKLTGKPESRFGFALANIGDLNKDGCDDLAIGSPYEGNGVVYIYLGNRKKGLDAKPKQIINAESLPVAMKTFGYSLAGGQDLDFNGYPDLLIGAYEQDSVALLFGRPIIDIKTYIRDSSTLKNIDPSKQGCKKDPEAGNTCFSFETCCKIEAFVKTIARPDSLTLNYVIEAETFLGGRKFSRVYFGNTRGNQKPHIIRRNINLETDDVHCQEHIVYIKENTRDIQTPIKFHVNYTLVQREPRWSIGGDTSVENYPVLNATQATLEFQAALLRDCGEDDICECKIDIKASMLLPKGTKKDEYTLTLGQENEVHLKVIVDNFGESAYEAQLFVAHHQGLDYIAANVTDKHVICNPFNKSMISCSLGNPFKKQRPEPHPIILRFDPRHLEDHEVSVDFSIWANSTSKDKDKKRHPIQLKAAIVKIAELSIKGSAKPEQVFYGGDVKGESAMKYFDDIGSRILHVYQVFNLGPWRVNSVDVIIDWPHQVANNKAKGKWLLYPDVLPSVESQGGGYCQAMGPINELNLTPRGGINEPALENLKMLDEQMQQSSMAKQSALTSRNQTNYVSHTRIRRDSEVIVKPQAYTDKDGNRHQIVHMNCQENTAKCIKIRCIIYKLHQNQPATIRITGRLWNSSLVEDYPKVGMVVIASRATLKLLSHYKNNLEDDSATVKTEAHPDLVFNESGDIPIWVYSVSSLAGLVVLICFILCLWKFGFFKRKRPLQSVNLNKNNEESPFLDKR